MSKGYLVKPGRNAKARRAQKKRWNGDGRKFVPNYSKIIQRDLERFFEFGFAANERSRLLEPLSILTTAGHANEGHGQFDARTRMPGISPHEILLLAHDDDQDLVEASRRRTSKEISSIKKILEELLDITTLLDRKPEDSFLFSDRKNRLSVSYENGRTFGDLHAFSPNGYLIEDPLSFLRGAYIASQMDNHQMRNLTVERYQDICENPHQFTIGTGSCHVGNLRKIRSLEKKGPIKNLLNTFTSEEITIRDLDVLYSEGIFVPQDQFIEHDDPNYRWEHINAFTRYSQGGGCCDDATLIGIALGELTREGRRSKALDAYHGAVLIDLVDTIDKISAFPITGGADEYLGEYINSIYKQRTGEDLATDEEIKKAIFFGAKSSYPGYRFSDSFNRFHRLQNNGIETITPHEAHVRFIQDGVITTGLNLGFSSDRMSSDKFYRALDRRAKLLIENELFSERCISKERAA